MGVSKIETGEHRMLISLRTGPNHESVPAYAYFSLDQETEIRALQIGQVVTFEGKLQGMDSDGRLSFRDCNLLRRRVVIEDVRVTS
jgi:hypothetical protein